MTILDHIEHLEIPDDRAKRHSNEIHSLNYLRRGLVFLYEQVNNWENEINAKLPKNISYMFVGKATIPGLPEVPFGLIACFFHWYAVSACNFVRMIGWLAYDCDSREALLYLKRVIPEVYNWRNKVSAHFAIIDPGKDDTPADLRQSVMFPLSFDGNAFYVGTIRITMSSKGETSTSRPNMRWSLTKTHSSLISRYWPSKTH